MDLLALTVSLLLSFFQLLDGCLAGPGNNQQSSTGLDHNKYQIWSFTSGFADRSGRFGDVFQK